MDVEEETTRTDTPAKIFRVITSAIIFFLVLGGSLISKATLLLITANMRSNLTLGCETDTANHTNTTVCYAIPKGNISNKGWLSDGFVERSVCEAVTVRWIWAGVLTVCAPYFMTFLHCLWVWIFKRKERPRLIPLITAFVVETLNAIGIAMLVFRILPALNSLQGAVVTLGASTVPAALRAFCLSDTRRYVQFVLDIIALLVQLTALIVWPALIGANRDKFLGGVFTQNPGATDNSLAVMIPFSLLLISVRYWQNYIDKQTVFYHETIGKLIQKLNEDRTVINVFTSIWKCAVTILMMMALLVRDRRSIEDLFSFSGHKGRCNNTISMTDLPQLNLDWVYVWLICFLSGLGVYSATQTAAQILTQRVCYAIPVWICTPVLLGSLAGACETWNQNNCTYIKNFRQWFHCYPPGGGMTVLIQQHIWIAVLWWLSQIWITRHVWCPWERRLTPAQKLLVHPLWDGVLLEQHVLHNRRRINTEIPENDPQTKQEERPTPYIYVCATMWHEVELEMTNLMKSILRLDEDQKRTEEGRTDRYKFEGHIYYDDAFRKDSHGRFVINSYVKKLISVMKQITSECPDVDKSKKFSNTPYGGSLKWKLPKGNVLICHLKNKCLIKNKKRWSQVMYMHYITDFSMKTNREAGDERYILALDGDVSFKPTDVMLLLDLMKSDENTGAVCGRIHPIGCGPMLCYQKFEYAIGHWLQKTSEDMLGCVLCSPGCFSLFRASSLVIEKNNKSILEMYSSIPEKPWQYLQYDQGEDRWLCTLLLKYGHRVAYCAASDAKTFAPEGFGEFFNQRRRWIPSTMANILDLLLHSGMAVKNNPNISRPYIMYQAFLFLLSALSPGMIYLMLTGALNSAYPELTSVWASVLSIIPVIIFIFVCFLARPGIQIRVAEALTVMYTLIQIVVFIGIVAQIAKEGLCSPVTVLFIFVSGTFILSAVLHPQDFFCLTHGLIYFLLIPSMYMLLMLYAVINLNVTSWGTRERKQNPDDGQAGCSFWTWLRCCLPWSSRLRHSTTQTEGFIEEQTPELTEMNDEQPIAEYEPANDPERQNMRAQNQPEISNIDNPSDEEWDNNTTFWTEVKEIRGAQAEQMTEDETEFYQDLLKKHLNPKPEVDGLSERETGLKPLRKWSSVSLLVINFALLLVFYTLRNKNVNISLGCREEKRILEPVAVLFITLYGVLIVIQLLCMLVHRVNTFLHIVAATSVFSRQRSEEYQRINSTVSDADQSQIEA